MKGWLDRFHAWCLQWVNTKWGTWALFICAFADACILPLPTPMFFLAISLLNISKAYRYALFGTLGTLAGAIVGYAIGYFLWLNPHGEFTGFAQFFLNNIPGFSAAIYDKIHILYSKWGFGILFVAACIPVPYKVFSISSGVFDINIFIFCTATLVSQGIKFYLLALLTKKFGPQVIKLLEFNWKPIAIIAMVCIAIGIIALKVF